MDILGTGIDIVENSRVKKLFITSKTKFKNKLFTKNEILLCEKKNKKINCYSKRFAAKEAFVKALGTGFKKNIHFRDIEITNNFDGKPHLSVNKKITNKIKSLFKIKKFIIFLSMSDEKKYSIASVIIVKK